MAKLTLPEKEGRDLTKGYKDSQILYADDLNALVGFIGMRSIQEDNITEELYTLNQLVQETNLTLNEKENNINKDISDLSRSLQETNLLVEGKIDGGFLSEGFLYLTSGGEVVVGPLGPFAGGGGGGGSSTNNAVINLTNTSGWTTTTISQSEDCYIKFTWNSLENEIPTGDGSLRVNVANITKANINIKQGEVTLNVAPYLNNGSNNVALTVTDIYGNMRTIRMTVNVVVLSLTSSFDNTAVYSGSFNFPYTPTGAVNKLVHFILDENEIGTVETSISGRQQSYTIPAQSHGAHTLRVYFEGEINGQTVSSNELYYEIICVETNNNTPIITSTFNKTTETQYNTITINYNVYTPNSLTTAIKIAVNDVIVSEQTVERNTQTFSYRADDIGTLNIKIYTGESADFYAEKVWILTITSSDINVEAETEGLALYLNAKGRSNGEATRNVWEYNNIGATLTGFNWRINGWLQDEEGIDVLRLNDDARVTIPYKLFGIDFKNTGKTIEIEFATREVSNYSATILSCLDGNIGLRITPQTIYFNGSQTSLSTLYKENEHVRLTVTVGKQSDNRLILIYINGIMSRAIQYAAGERFDQSTPANITIGNNECGIDIYTIRVYDQDLTDRGVLDNWIADTQIGSMMQERYVRNHVYSDSGDITIDTMPNNLPYMIIEATVLPQFKDDKKTVSGRYVDPVNPAKSFSFSGCQMNVQGTSSAVYYRKNWDLQFKKGFEMADGTHATTYALRDNSIPFNRFVLKADVASSESANNTGLTMYYNDACPYKTPEMLADERVRWGIEGVPIVLFHYDPSTGTTEFLGKHNFNLPKRAPAPYGYDSNSNLESWEFERNNSDNVKFKDFDITSESWDEVKQTYYPTWYDDWEARFPSDEWRNTDRLGEFVRWVVSTDREKATNTTLETSITYTLRDRSTLNSYSSDSSYTVTPVVQNNVTTGYSIEFTKDTPAYRLTKFKAEASEYMVLNSAIFYYIFTHQFLMIDSRAKNMFIGFNGDSIEGDNRAMDRLVTFQPYDMDTALGTNNSGVLMFGYSLEDTDTVSSVISGEEGSNANVFNAQDSVLWLNIRDAFRAEIAAMYTSLRTSNDSIWNYKYIENWFEQHQSKWSEAIFNEDARTKYLVPLIDAVTVDEDTGQKITTDRYLTMLQGSKTEQRKWWLYNRFRYMDSKYNTGNASTTIDMRLFHEGNLTITPAIDLYVGVRFGGGSTAQLQRTSAGEPVTFNYSAPSGVTEMETWIFSADLITDVGDLSVFYPNELNFSRATRLKRLKIGSGESGYENSNLRTLDVRNSTLLEYIDCRNCPNLAITIDLEGSPRLKEAYFEGTSITGIELADGATIETLHLPETIATLTLMNLNKLTDLQIDSLDNITRLMLANMDDNVINAVETLSNIPQGTRIYIEGLNLELANAGEIEDFLDLLDSMKGVTRERGANGVWLYHDYDTAQVSGRIHTGSLTGAQIASYNERYPYIVIDADHTTSNLYYYTYDGSQLLETETIHDGGNGTYTGAPTRTQDAQYTYTFAGWSTKMNSLSADSNATKNVTADRNVYAAYTATVRSYTITFARTSDDGGGTLQSSAWAYGSTPRYTGATPTTVIGDADDYPFLGWTPEIGQVTGAKTYYARFGSPAVIEEITDDWNTIIEHIENGTAKSRYQIGNYKTLNLGTIGNAEMQIVGFDADTDANGNSVPVTLISKDCLKDKYRMQRNNDADGGYPKSDMKSYLENTVLPKIASPVSDYITPVLKTSAQRWPEWTTLTNYLKIWIPSYREIFGGTSYEKRGTVYNSFFSNQTTRIKYLNSTAATWWLRSVPDSHFHYIAVLDNGNNSIYSTSTSLGVVPGFCLSPDTIHDSWSEINTAIQNGTYKTKYSIGDTKMVDLGVDGKIVMQIVAFDTDTLADGSGTAAITWIAKNALANGYQFNDANSTANVGYTDLPIKTTIDALKTRMPETLQNMVMPVTKTFTYKNGSNTTQKSASLELWIPSMREIVGGTTYETSGPIYDLYSNSSTRETARTKKKYGNTSTGVWWTRSIIVNNGNAYARNIDSTTTGSSHLNTTYSIVLGFCTGATPTT